jgi:hypothetical protein
MEVGLVFCWSRAVRCHVSTIVSRLKPAKVKNISYDGLGTKEGRVHMERQDFEKLQTRKIKALKVLKKRQKYEDAHGGAGDGSDAEGDDREDGEDGSEEPAPSRNKRARK